jgi:hypothetical protein
VNENLGSHKAPLFFGAWLFRREDSYYVEQKVQRPATHHHLDPHNKILSQQEYFKWYYARKTLAQITEEFLTLFEQILKNNRKVKK